jgi:hypothetical protein
MAAVAKHGSPVAPDPANMQAARHGQERAALLLVTIAFAVAFCVLCALCVLRIRCPL